MSKQGWTYKKLGDYIIEYSVKNKSKEDIPVYSVTNSQGFCKEYFSKEVASQDKSTYKIVPFGFFAYNPSRINVGPIDWQRVEEKVIVSPLYNVFGVSENLLQSYLLYFLKSPITLDYINKIATGTVRLNLKFSMLKELSLRIPPVAEQERIVEELDLLSGIIEKKKEQLNAYDQLAQSIFYTMFGDPITNEKGWEVKKLGEVATIGTGATPSRENEEIYYGGDIHWVKTTEVQNCDITKTEETITQLAVDQTNCKVFPPNTLLMAMYGQGKTRGQIAKLRINAATNQACAAILLDFNICHLEYVYELLLIQYEYIRAMAQGGNQANLNMKLVASIPIICPPLSLQQEFAAKIEAIEQQKALIQQSIAEVQTLFDSRMDYWFG